MYEKFLCLIVSGIFFFVVVIRLFYHDYLIITPCQYFPITLFFYLSKLPVLFPYLKLFELSKLLQICISKVEPLLSFYIDDFYNFVLDMNEFGMNMKRKVQFLIYEHSRLQIKLPQMLIL